MSVTFSTGSAGYVVFDTTGNTDNPPDIIEVLRAHAEECKNAKCLWDTVPEEGRLKPMGLSCPCPKCSPR